MLNDPPDEIDGREFTSAATFGPAFFLGPLRAFARDCCPSPAEALPSVSLHLATGEVLELCHVMGLAPGFVALAVLDDVKRSGSADPPMRTEILSYNLVTRVTIRERGESGPHVGFNPAHAPPLLTRGSSPEEMLRAVAAAPRESERSRTAGTLPKARR